LSRAGRFRDRYIRPMARNALQSRPAAGHALSRIEAAFRRAETALARANTLPEMLRAHGHAEALRVLCVKAKADLAFQNRAAEIRLRAERRAGAMLAKLPRRQGARTDRTSRNGHAKLTYRQALKENALPEPTARRWKYVADVPARAFEEHVKTVTTRHQELTTNSVLKLRPQRSNVITISPDGKHSTSSTGSLKDDHGGWADAWELVKHDPECWHKMEDLRRFFRIEGMTDAVVELITRAHREWIDAK